MAFLKKTLGFTLLLGLGLLCFTEPAFAQTGVGDLFALGGKAIVISIASIVIIFCSVFATLFAVLIGNLMGSTFILDAGMGEILQLVWVVMRNFTNIALLLMLLGFAVLVVLNIGGDEQGGIALAKKFLPKFMIALIAVNFTFFGARMILTVNDVLATAVFSLPQAVWQENVRGLPCQKTATAAGPGNKPNTADCLHEITQSLKEVTTGQVTEAGGDADAAAQTGSTFEKLGGFIQNIYSGADSAFVGWLDRENFALAMLTNILDLKTIVTLNASTNSFFGTLVATIGALITTIITTFVFFFLLTALVVRMVYLWVLIALSPLAVAMVILKELVPGLPGGDNFDMLGDFIKYAFLPLFMAFPLSIGMIMIFAGNSLTSLGSTSSDAITAALSGDVFALLWWWAAIGVIWVGTKKMMDDFAPDVVKGLTESVYTGVNSFGAAAAGSIKYAPIIPIPTGSGVSPFSFNALKAIPEGFQGQLNTSTGERGRGLGRGLGAALRPDLAKEDAKEVGKTISEELINGIKSSDFTGTAAKIFDKRITNGKATGETIISAAAVQKISEAGGFEMENKDHKFNDLFANPNFRNKLGAEKANEYQRILAERDAAAGEEGKKEDLKPKEEKTEDKINVSTVVQSLQSETDHAAFKTKLDELAAAVAAGQTLKDTEKDDLIIKIKEEEKKAAARNAPEEKEWNALLGEKLLQ